LRFSEDGDYLAAWTKEWEKRDTLRVWNVETRQIVASINQRFHAASLAAGGRVLVAALVQGNDHEIAFYDLSHPNRAPRRVQGRQFSDHLAVSPDGRLVASSTGGGQIRLFDPAKGELIRAQDGHMKAAFGLAFSPGGRRLISASGDREAIKLWDVGTREELPELLTLDGTGSVLGQARWSADGDVILVGPTWQAWRAPSWEEIEAVEAKERAEIKRP
jgi:WD40 repeat protein